MTDDLAYGRIAAGDPAYKAGMRKETLTRRIRVFGIVQGVGFRPSTVRLAKRAGVSGTVANRGPYVEIYARGTKEQLDHFRQLLETESPERAEILKIREETVPAERRDGETSEHSGEPSGKTEEPSEGAEEVSVQTEELSGERGEAPLLDFRIIPSGKTRGEIYIPPDLAVCEDCRRELLDPSNRRYLHPFINCTACGPRLTILEKLPYDRERTSMKMFPMCSACSREYHDPHSRRFDAQPVCCPDCGPKVYTRDPVTGEICEHGHAAIVRARQVLAEGGILAVKGIGGFHLCCDATREETVEELRRRKHRPAKPFAVMLKSLAAVRRECRFTPAQERLLTGHQKPILLLPRRTEGTAIAPAVAPDCPTLGVMLPYAPVQILLFQYDDGLQLPDALVMTSGNAAGAPIARDDAGAVSMLGGICDCILSNNRPILTRADDSVVDFYQGEPYMIRRSRGYAPLPVMVEELEEQEDDEIIAPQKDRVDQAEETEETEETEKTEETEETEETEKTEKTEKQGITQYEGRVRESDHAGRPGTSCVIGIGGELKNTFCISRDGLFYPSAYVGDLGDVRAQQALEEALDRMLQLLEAEPSMIVCDLHPLYHSSAAAEGLGRKLGIQVLRIQHHYAHILSCMAENDYTGSCIGIAMDGTGYGEDGSVWGGELLLASAKDYRRAGSIAPFAQVGGDAAAREGWRIAVSMLGQMQGKREQTLEQVRLLDLCSPGEASLVLTMQAQGINAVQSTSAGRLFDAVAAVLGIRRQSTFEGEASATLMYRAMEYAPASGSREPGSEIANTGGQVDSAVGRILRELEQVPLGRASDGRLLLPTDALFRLVTRERLRWLSEQGRRDPDASERSRSERETPARPESVTAAAAAEAAAGELPAADFTAADFTAADFTAAGAAEGEAACGKDSNALALAYAFHEGLARLLVRGAVELRAAGAPNVCALSGGCFQNRLLLSLVQQGLAQEGFQVLRHHLIPPNDGGIALGQAFWGALAAADGRTGA